MTTPSVLAQELPPHFFSYEIARGLIEPTSIAFLPNHDVLISEKSGKIKRLKIGQDKFDTYFQMKTETTGERGLQSVIVHPDFPNTPYFFIYYTKSDGSRNRFSRIKVIGEILREEILIEFEPMNKEAVYHNGGGVTILDNKIYLGIGEQYGLNSQDLNSYNGKIIRINIDGTIPTDNPISEGSLVQRSTWSYGLRNPFTIDADKVTKKIFVNDVGYDSWEEINDASKPFLFFGWPYGEGDISHYNPNFPFVDPIFKYPNIVSNKTDITENKGCAITAGVFYRPSKSSFPNEYIGKYFFSDMCNGWIRTLDPASFEQKIFAKKMESGTFGFKYSSEGDLFYLNYFEGSLKKIVYDTVASPRFLRNISDLVAVLGDTLIISTSISGNSEMKMKWFKDGKQIAGLDSTSITFKGLSRSSSGTYFAVAYNSFGSDSSNFFKILVKKPNSKLNSEISFTKIEPILRKNGCSVCHNKETKLTGPPFIEIAKRGYTNARILALLNKPEPKNWPDYPIPMASMSNLNQEEALKIAQWINSLTSNKSPKK